MSAISGLSRHHKETQIFHILFSEPEGRSHLWAVSLWSWWTHRGRTELRARCRGWGSAGQRQRGWPVTSRETRGWMGQGSQTPLRAALRLSTALGTGAGTGTQVLLGPFCSSSPNPMACCQADRTCVLQGSCPSWARPSEAYALRLSPPRCGLALTSLSAMWSMMLAL